MPKKLPPEVLAFFAQTGAEGGRSGKGAAKRRGGKAHYKHLAMLSAEARAKKRRKRAGEM